MSAKHVRPSDYYLRSIRIEAFGAFAQRDVGPFTSGLNVVYGPNEAGKTTVAELVSGVLFGWEEARGNRNVYKPVNAERCGTLVFAPKAGEGAEQRLTRARNVDGIAPDPAPSVLADIDRETYRSVFSLDADQLRGLGKTSRVTSRLLTAGAGTAASPAEAMARIDEELAALTSRGKAHVNSIPNLRAALADAREAMNRGQAEADQLKQEDHEYRELAERRASLMAAVKKSNEELEVLTVQRAALVQAEDARAQLEERSAQLEKQESELEASMQAIDDAGRPPSIDAVEERTLRAQMDDLSEQRGRAEHALSIAQQDAIVSQAEYEALLEADDMKELERLAKRQRLLQILLSVVLPVVFAVLGVPVFLRGRAIGSLSVTALGIFLVVAAFGMACAAFAMLLRPNHADQERTNRIADAQWVMQKDAKKLEVSKNALAAQDAQIARFLSDAGLTAANGSLRRARALLDEWGEVRADESVLAQRRQSLRAQRASLDAAFARNEADRAAALSALGAKPDTPLAVVDARIARVTEQRDDQLRTIESINTRYGELGQVLAQARHARDFDDAKLEHAMLTTRLADSMQDYARLLLEKRLLARAISAWEGQSQPAVYRRASTLLAQMTAGAWTSVRISGEGHLEVADDRGTVRDPLYLSTGTRQQLYLALRIALLQEASNVGRTVPVVCDDILVNFDDDRRASAAAALADLARTRQVIVFTCHREVVRLLRDAGKGTNVVEL